MEKLRRVLAYIVLKVCIVYSVGLHAVLCLHFLNLNSHILCLFSGNVVSQSAHNVYQICRVYLSFQTLVVVAKCLFN